MGFVVQYPLFFISKGAELAITDLKHESAEAHAKAIPVFTDEEAAEAFRDEFFPGWRLGTIPDEPFFAKLLAALTEDVFCVAFDPWRMNTRPVTIPINVMLEQLRGGVE